MLDEFYLVVARFLRTIQKHQGELPLAIGENSVSICLINQKGGCGKSSTCFHLAGSFSKIGLKVLIVDADPQGSISQAFFGSESVEEMSSWQTLAAIFDDNCNQIDSRSLIRPTGSENIFVIPANHHMSRFNCPSPELGGITQFAMRDFLEPLNAFDIVLFDCPPNLYQCSWNAMIAADFVLIPIPPEDFGTQGIRAVHQAVSNARTLNPGLRRLGHLVTRSDRRMLVHQAYESRLRETYGELVLKTTIPELTAFKVALACRQPVEMHAPKSKAADRTRQLVQEILGRIRSRQHHREAA